MKLRKIKRWFYTPLKPIYLTIDDCRFVCFIKLENTHMGIFFPETLVYSRDFKKPIFLDYISNILSNNRTKKEIRESFKIPIQKVKRMKELENNEIV